MSAVINLASDRSRERSAYRLISALADSIDRDSPLTIALVFSRIAAAGPSGVFQATVQRELGLTAASMTRSLQTLSDGHHTKAKPGLGLISRQMDFARDGRQHILQLTDKGRQLAQAGVSAISEQQNRALAAQSLFRLPTKS
jgi:DNA-binding MarR family transcriptional regulator